MAVRDDNSRLKILFLSQRFLYPMDTGGKIRTGKILERLGEVFDITIICNIEHPKDDKYISNMQNLCKELYPVSWKEKQRYSLKFYIDIFFKMFSTHPVSVLKYYSKDIQDILRSLLEKNRYDFLVCDFLQSSLNVVDIGNIPKILFQHNVESVIAERHFENSKRYIEKVFWWFQWKKMERYERKACKRFKGIITVSEIDKKILEEKFCAKNVFSIPTGVDTLYFSPREGKINANSLVFSGSMDWLPNEDAILFFAHNILGKIKQQITQIKLTVVGRNPSRRLLRDLKAYPEIEVVGWVRDVRPFISSHALYVVPIRIGGGTRIKVYEAMAMGKAVVSTSIGTEGLPVNHGEHVILADEADDFAQAVIMLLRDAGTRRCMERAALNLVRNHFSWDKAASSFAEACWEIVDT